MKKLLMYLLLITVITTSSAYSMGLFNTSKTYLQNFPCSSMVQDTVKQEMQHAEETAYGRMFLKNFVIKPQLNRLDGAAIINKAIATNNLNLLFVPHKCACVLDNKVSLVAARVSVVDEPFDLPQVQQLCSLIKKTIFFDTHGGNIKQTSDGRVAIIDTEMRGFGKKKEYRLQGLYVMKINLNMEPEARNYLKEEIQNETIRNDLRELCAEYLKKNVDKFVRTHTFTQQL